MALSLTQSSWRPVADILSKQGYNVTLVENPLTSLAADVEATKQALAKQNGKTVLVGHSWGGVVITEAGNDPKVSALVYVSAFAPDVGQSLATLAASGPPTEGAAAIHPDAKGNLYIDPKVFPSAVAADLPLQVAESLANSQLPLSHVAFEAPVDIGRLARQTDVLCDHHKGQGHRARGPEAIRRQDACADDGGRRQPCLPRQPCKRSRRGHRRGRARGMTIGLPAIRAGSLTLAQSNRHASAPHEPSNERSFSGQSQYIRRKSHHRTCHNPIRQDFRRGENSARSACSAPRRRILDAAPFRLD